MKNWRRMLMASGLLLCLLLLFMGCKERDEDSTPNLPGVWQASRIPEQGAGGTTNYVDYRLEVAPDNSFTFAKKTSSAADWTNQSRGSIGVEGTMIVLRMDEKWESGIWTADLFTACGNYVLTSAFLSYTQFGKSELTGLICMAKQDKTDSWNGTWVATNYQITPHTGYTNTQSGNMTVTIDNSLFQMVRNVAAYSNGTEIATDEQSQIGSTVISSSNIVSTITQVNGSSTNFVVDQPYQLVVGSDGSRYLALYGALERQ